MRRNIFSLLVLLLFLCKGLNSFASHIFGGDLLYTYISDSTYKITLTLYGDCTTKFSTGSSFPYLDSAKPEITIYYDSVFFRTISLKGEEIGTEVSPVCTREMGNTNCHEGGTLAGVSRFIYSTTVTIPSRGKWSFAFKGNLANSQAGRSGSITNIRPGGVSVMELRANLDNRVSDNSSPAYSSIPTPYYCINLTQEYNQGAIDADGDSLSFSLVPATEGSSTSSAPVTYIGSFSGSEPLATDSGTFYFNVLNGQMTFTPSNTQHALVVCQVSEYRNGVLIGTSEREMTFVVLDNCEGTPPVTKINNVVGGSITGTNIINICIGTPAMSFNVNLSNPDRDNTTITNSTLPVGATININSDNTPDPSVAFAWNTTNVSTGIYTFYLTIRNDHCPLALRQTVAYTINVLPTPIVTSRVLSPTQCLHKAQNQYDIQYGYTPRKLTIKNSLDAVYATYIDSTGSGIIIDSLPYGTYTAIVSSNPSCVTTSSFTVPDSGDLPLPPITKHYCVNGPATELEVPLLGPEARITWYTESGATIFFPPILNTKIISTTLWYYTQEYHQCISDKIPFTTIVHPLPVPEISKLTRPEDICLGDTIYLLATGGNKYIWTPDSLVLGDSTDTLYIRVTKPVALQLKVIDEFGCADSATIRYNDIQQCCVFSYPNAFTPNMDGKNDGFRVVNYGNMTQYNLIIYNRWGQQVFQSSDPGRYWDGTFNGIPCDMGTYFYYFKGQCLTGKKEESKGDVILIR